MLVGTKDGNVEGWAVGLEGDIVGAVGVIVGALDGNAEGDLVGILVGA